MTRTLIPVNVSTSSELVRALDALDNQCAVEITPNGYVQIRSANGTGWEVVMSFHNNVVASPGNPGLLRSFPTTERAVDYFIEQVKRLRWQYPARSA